MTTTNRVPRLRSLRPIAASAALLLAVTTGGFLLGAPASAATPTSTATPTPTAPDLSAQPTTIEVPIGTPADVAVHATGYPAPTYTLVAKFPDPDHALEPGISMTPDGHITGTTTVAGSVLAVLTATNAVGSVSEDVTIVVPHGPAAQLESWFIQYTPGVGNTTSGFAHSNAPAVPVVTVPAGSAPVRIGTTILDAYGNDAFTDFPPTITSSVPSDTIVATGQASIAFAQTGTRTVTITANGWTTTTIVDVGGTGTPPPIDRGALPDFTGVSTWVSGTVAQPISSAFTAASATPVTYHLEYGVSEWTALPAGLVFHPDGTLTGSTTVAGFGTVVVVATNAVGSASVPVTISIAGGAPTEVAVAFHSVFPGVEQRDYIARVDGTNDGPIPVPAGGGELVVSEYWVDAYGNDVAGPFLQQITVTSTIASDVMRVGGTRGPSPVFVTLTDPGRRVLTVTAPGQPTIRIVAIEEGATSTPTPTATPTPTLTATPTPGHHHHKPVHHHKKKHHKKH